MSVLLDSAHSTASADAGAQSSWTTPAGLLVHRTSSPAGNVKRVTDQLARAIDERRGMLIYRGADRAVGYCDPPLEVTIRGRILTVAALNRRGALLLGPLATALAGTLELEPGAATDGALSGRVPVADGMFAEEERTRHAGAFTAIRSLLSALASPADPLLGLYGAFGYDLVFHMHPIALRQSRDSTDRDLVLHLPDEIFELDLRRAEAVRHRYEFTHGTLGTAGLPRLTQARAFAPGDPCQPRDHAKGEYAEVVRRALPMFDRGELFEVVPGQAFRRRCAQPPSQIFDSLLASNPAPHSLLLNLGGGEYLIGASPEMFIRVRRGADGRNQPLVIESAPISGTTARGRDAFEDAEQIRGLLNSAKDEAELTMCTDVDRNDKARVCLPGSVRVTARRSIEVYSTLIHTVDHVEGRLAPGFDALDGFLTHMWAVTVTGAPKLAAIEFIEREERSSRRWYGGAVGVLALDGTLDTVLTLRTIHVRDGVATVRTGATLLSDSSPAAEEAETELKALALLRVLDQATPERRGLPARPAGQAGATGAGKGPRVLLIDHRDSFVHNLADYLRQTGAEVTTYRAGSHLPALVRQRPDLLVLSPGPGRPVDFEMNASIEQALDLGVAIFGVCLGLQGLVEHFGGTLATLGRPMHGKESEVRLVAGGGAALAGLPDRFTVGRYHSLHAASACLPAELRVTAITDDGVIMAVEHTSRPLAAVQFHPESIMTARDDVGHRIIANAVAAAIRHRTATPLESHEDRGRCPQQPHAS